jgi:hypothetical protein
MSLEIVGIDDHFARRDLFFADAVITQFADAQSVLGPDWRPKDAAGHRSRGVEIAGPGHWIENRTRLVVSKFLEAFGCFCALVQNAGREIAGKILPQSINRSASALPNPGCPLWVRGLQISETLLQPEYIKLIDREYAHTALRAPNLANQPVPAASRCISQGSVRDLHQLVVAGW